MSKPRSLSPLIVALFLLVVAMPGAAAELAEQVDPVEVPPTQFKIDFENDHVRIVSYHLQPGERDNWHTHPAEVSVITGGGLLRITKNGWRVSRELGAIQPVAVFLNNGVGKDLLINIVLCLFFYIPGILHALWLITK